MIQEGPRHFEIFRPSSSRTEIDQLTSGRDGGMGGYNYCGAAMKDET